MQMLLYICRKYEAMIPTFFLEIDETTQTGVERISLVARPAVEIDFLRFNKQPEKQLYEITDNEKREVFGVVMLPDTPIYRNNERMGEHNVVFTKEMVKKIAQRFFNEFGTKAVNLDHTNDTNDVTIYESYIVERERGKLAPESFENVPDGTWLASMKVNSDQLWGQIKAGTYNGFSVEGFFTYGESFNKFNLKNHEMEEVKKMLFSMKKTIGKMIHKFAEAVAEDGTVLLWADDVQPTVGTLVSTYDDAGEVVPAMAGTYVIEGTTWVIGEGGAITEVIPAEASEPEPEAAATETAPQNSEFAKQVLEFATILQKTSEQFEALNRRVEKLEKTPLANPEQKTTPPVEGGLKNPLKGMFQ